MTSEELGKIVRKAWVDYCIETGKTDKPDHLVPWEELNDWGKEVDRRIGVAIVHAVVKENRDLFFSAVVCLSCNNVFDDVAPEDSCAACGIRYSPKPSNENCHECGSDDYITHCMGCDAEEPEYLDELISGTWKEYFDPEDDDYGESSEAELIRKIEGFIEKRLREINK